MKKIIKNIFKNAKIEINNEKIEKFATFFDFLVQENEKYNLTRIIEKEDVAVKHFLDSVSCEKFLKQNAKIIDIGAGAGFPSIPLKIMRDDLSFVLVDSVNKKIEFLNQLKDKLGLKSVECLHARIEDLAHETNFRESFDIAVARAVAELNVLAEYCLPFVKDGGLMIAYKSDDCQEEVDRAKKSINILGGEIVAVEKYELSDGRRNSLIIIKKVGRTPNQFPRRKNLPRKNPII